MTTNKEKTWYDRRPPEIPYLPPDSGRKQMFKWSDNDKLFYLNLLIRFLEHHEWIPVRDLKRKTVIKHKRVFMDTKVGDKIIITREARSKDKYLYKVRMQGANTRMQPVIDFYKIEAFIRAEDYSFYERLSRGQIKDHEYPYYWTVRIKSSNGRKVQAPILNPALHVERRRIVEESRNLQAQIQAFVGDVKPLPKVLDFIVGCETAQIRALQNASI